MFGRSKQISQSQSILLTHSSVILMQGLFILFTFSCRGPHNADHPENTRQIPKETRTNPTNHPPEEVFDIRPTVFRVIAFRGAPMAVPVQFARSHSINEPLLQAPVQFPKSAAITTSDGRRITGQVRWLRTVPSSRFWHSPDALTHAPAPTHQSSRPVRETSDNETAVFPWAESPFPAYEVEPPPSDKSIENYHAFLLLEDGGDLATGLTRIGKTILAVDVFDRPQFEALQPPADIRWPDDDDWWAQPDQHSPLEALRRSLLPANTLGPTSMPSHDRLLDVLAQQNAARFQLKLLKLAEVSPSVADTLVETLSRTARDGRITFATWPLATTDLAELDRLLLTEPPPEQEKEWASAILAWIEQQPPAVMWIESAHGDSVRLAVANLTNIAAEVNLRWQALPDKQSARAIRIPARTVYRTRIDRPNRTDDEAILKLFVGRSTRPIQTTRIRPAVESVVPPHTTLGPVWKMWRLESWLKSSPIPAYENESTRILLRYLDHHWQLFGNCRINTTSNEPSPESKNAASGINDDNDEGRNGQSELSLSDASENPRNKEEASLPISLSATAGVEAMTLFVGPYAQPNCVLTISPSGAVRVWRSQYAGSEKKMIEEMNLEVRRADSAWEFSISLPDAWIQNSDQTLQIGYIRTHQNTLSADCYPQPCLPWRLDPGRTRFDLAAWSPSSRIEP